MYFENSHLVVSEEDFWGNMMSGKYPIIMIWASGAIERGKKFNFEYGVMQPEIGVPTVVEQLALIKGSKNKEKAKEFINWLGSAEQQGKWAENFGTIPALPKAMEVAPAEVKALASKVKAQNIDWKFVAENVDSWVEKAQLQYIK